MTLAEFAEEDPKQSFLMRTHLFDAYGIPWTSRFSLGWTYFIFVFLGVLLGPLLGLYIGLWLVAKHRSAASLLLYLALIGSVSAALIPSVLHGNMLAQTFVWAAPILWFAGSFTLHHQVASLYREIDRTDLMLSYVYTAIFGVWYINYHLRPMWPV